MPIGPFKEILPDSFNQRYVVGGFNIVRHIRISLNFISGEKQDECTVGRDYFERTRVIP
jgi:hypothetical protein